MTNLDLLRIAIASAKRPFSQICGAGPFPPNAPPEAGDRIVLPVAKTSDELANLNVRTGEPAARPFLFRDSEPLSHDELGPAQNRDRPREAPLPNLVGRGRGWGRKTPIFAALILKSATLSGYASPSGQIPRLSRPCKANQWYINLVNMLEIRGWRWPTSMTA